MGDFLVHRIPFFEWTPQMINGLAYDKATQRLAVSRADGSIELWSRPDNWYQEKVIAVAEKRQVDGIVWMNSRLFSVGMDSIVVEYDLVSLAIKRQVTCNTQGMYCVTKNEPQQQLAVGTEDGCVMLFDAKDDQLEYLRSFDKLEGRIMCIAWHTGEGVIVTGGVHILRIWSVKSGHALQRILLGNDDTLVWCVAVTSDLTIISGDSQGKVSFWNGKQGTRITQFQSHKADVLTLSVDESEQNVFCAGIDPKLVKFSFMPPSDDNGWRPWVRSSTRTFHTHDVRACVVVGHSVVTGGVDTTLSFSHISGNDQRFLRVPAVPSVPLVTVAKAAELVMLNYPTFLEIWRLGHTEAPPTCTESDLPMDYGALKLVRIEAQSGERITCSAISPDGSLVAFSDRKLRVQKLTYTGLKSQTPQVELSRLRLRAANHHAAQRLAITPDGRRLVAATSAPSLQIWDVSGEEGTLVYTVLPEGSEAVSFTNMSVSDNSQMAATSDSGGNVHLYRLRDGQVMCKLPRQSHQATALAFTPAARSLLVAYSNRKVMEFDVLNEEYSAWSRGARFPDQWLRQRGLLKGIACQPSAPNKVFLHSEHNLLVIDRSQPMPESDYPLFKGKKPSDTPRCLIASSQYRVSCSRSRSHRHRHSPSDTPRCLIASSQYRFILHMEFLNTNTLVIVERTPRSIQDLLPSSLDFKKFGT
ncbi:hypothetical protein ACOMHN_007006 [Nucella lapillus]